MAVRGGLTIKTDLSMGSLLYADQFFSNNKP